MLLACAAQALGAEAPAAVDLRPEAQAGRSARYQVWTVRQTTSTLKSSEGDSRTSTSLLELDGQVTWTVLKARADGAATCSMTVDYLTATITPSEGAVEYNDSRKASGDTDQVQRMLRAMCGVALKVEVGADGSIGHVTGMEAMKRRAGGGGGDQDGVEVPDELDWIETASDLATLCAAPAAVAPGKGWECTLWANCDTGMLRHAMRYTLGGVEEIAGIPVATVTGTGRTSFTVDKNKIAGGDAKVDVRLVSGQVDTQVMFDLQRHEAVGRNTVEQREFEVRIRTEEAAFSNHIREVIQGQALRLSED
jgi:hypothetical protein